jgi:hypothetical protein
LYDRGSKFVQSHLIAAYLAHWVQMSNLCKICEQTKIGHSLLFTIK